MISAFNAQMKIAVPVGGEDVVFTLRRPSAKETSKFLNSRFEQKRNKLVSKLYEARVAFIDSLLVDISNAQYETAAGELKPLNKDTVLSADDAAHASRVLDIPVNSWKDLIPVSWKSSVAMQFEDSNQGGDEEGN